MPPNWGGNMQAYHIVGGVGGGEGGGVHLIGGSLDVSCRL